MTIDKSEKISMPKWVILFIVPLLGGAIGGIASGSFSAGKRVQQIETLQTIAVENKTAIKEKDKEIKEIKETKADKIDMERIYNSLDRIEGKFDQHIVGIRMKGSAQ
jgi:hypothetical protein